MLLRTSGAGRRRFREQAPPAEGAVVALQTSVKAVLANPLTVAVWGLIVGASLAIGSL